MALPSSTQYILDELKKHSSCTDATWAAIVSEADEKGFANLSKSAREQVRVAKMAWQAHQKVVRRAR